MGQSMIQPSFSDLFGADDETPVQKTAIQIMQNLTKSPCTDCRLGLENKNNAGFLWYGNPDASIAVVGDTPTGADVSNRRAFADEVGNELFSWFDRAGIPRTDLFFTYLVQCNTPTKKSKVVSQDGKQRDPDWQETSVCFPNRAVKVLKALPNLKVICPLGNVSWLTLLGGDPKVKSHMGFWFGTDLFPGKAIFCLPHPRDFNQETSQMKRDRLKQHMLYFVNEYYGRKDGETVLCPPGKALSVLEYREKDRKRTKSSFSLF